ncbi:class I SAM-dependent methyltransferase [Candidatus Dojkabacteria bacterium]|jgi:SAM-dependent methyltransferase|nr:class I SAM-dependent methyltransferase [Candidatus Dojkabacteria bacterium]
MIDDCTKIEECVACGYKTLIPVLDLKDQPLANSFVKEKGTTEMYFPLAINRCDRCFHVQLSHQVNPDLLFKDYLYVSGTAKTQLDYFQWFAKFILENHPLNNPESILDIGCNDGSQLDVFKSMGLDTYGIDPAINLFKTSSKNHRVICDYFNKNTFDDNVVFDIITCQNAFAHNYNPLEFLSNAKKVMGDHSLLYITTSQANMILNNEFDTIYHEHISFYNIKSMSILCKRAGLNLIDVIRHPIHGRSYIFVISKFFNRPSNIENLINLELDSGLYDSKTYNTYANKCQNIIFGFERTIKNIRSDGYSIIGYGAPAKGNTLMNAAKIGPDFIIDDSPLKQGLYTPGLNIPIFGVNELKKYKDVNRVCFIPLAWNFFPEIKEKITKIRPNKEDMFVRYFPSVMIDDNGPIMHHQV